MESEMADFTPGAAVDETYTSSLILAHLLHYVNPQNWKFIKYCTDVREGLSHGHR